MMQFRLRLPDSWLRRFRPAARHRWRACLRVGGARFRKLSQAIALQRSPISMALLLSLLLLVPDQTREIYRSLAESPVENVVAIFFAAMSVLVMSMALTLVSTANFRRNSPDRPRSMFSFLIGWCPILGLSAGLILSRTPASAFPNDQVNFQLVILAAGFFLLATLWLTLFALSLARRVFMIRRTGRLLASPRFTGVCAVLILATTALTFDDVTGAAFGAIAILCLFALVTLVVSSHLAALGDRFGYPLLSTLLFAATFFSIAGWNNNHAVRRLPGPTTQSLDHQDAFETWLESRADRNAYAAAGKPYPVYVVAAEGGGVYAAFHAAMVLARLQDACPRFAQHVFAISGVSGGSLGATLFGALASRMAPNDKQLDCQPVTAEDGEFQKATRRFFTNDLLAPLVAAALFPDFLQRFLPFPIEEFDRARALERAIERAWRTSVPPAMAELFGSDFSALWTPDGSAPALLLNTTLVQNGRREIVAPFESNIASAPQTLIFLGARNRIPASTAAVLSARFPWLTPAGSFDWDGEVYQFADGGYFDNSGADTAHNLIRSLSRRPSRGANDGATGGVRADVKFKFISIRAEVVPADPGVAGEFGAPVLTLLNARQERGIETWRAAFLDLCDGCSPKELDRADAVHSHLLSMRQYAFPLGWYLSPSNQRRLVELVSDGKSCPLGQRVARADIDRANACALRDVYYQLAGEGDDVRN